MAVSQLIDISTLDLKLHKDTDSPFAIRQDTNDNWNEINDWTVELKKTIDIIDDEIGKVSPEKIIELIRELIKEAKLKFKISPSMLDNEVINITDDILLVRTGKIYTLSIENADELYVKVIDSSNDNEVHPSIVSTATEIKLYFDVTITSDMKVTIF